MLTAVATAGRSRPHPRVMPGWALALLLAAFSGPAVSHPISVFVSILPEKYFVDRVGGAQVDVSVLVGPGQEPETYEPTPRQMVALSHARVYFRIGVPFETVWIARIQAANPRMLVADLAQGIVKRPLERIGAQGTAGAGGLPDPHVWLSPPLAKRMCERIRDVLTELDPTHRSDFARNYAAFAAELDTLNQEIHARVSGLKEKAFITFHPAWGYFADTYGLKQIPIEVEGKEPGPRTLLRLIDEAKRLRIRVVFVEPQFSRSSAEMVAREIGGRVVTIDPLAEDYLRNMRSVAAAFSASAGTK